MAMAMISAGIGSQSYISGSKEPTEVGPCTFLSATVRLDVLVLRMNEVRVQAETIASSIGGLCPIPNGAKGDAKTQDPSLVHRLNDAAEYSHAVLSDIEGILSSIQRSLG
jgi:hypothetical protein